MDDIEAKTGFGQIAGPSAGAVVPGLEPADERQAGEPAVNAVERAAHILRRSIVLSEGGHDEDDAGDGGAGEQRNPGFLHLFLHLVVREHEVAHQEGNQVKQRLVQVQEPIGRVRSGLLDERLLPYPEQHP